MFEDIDLNRGLRLGLEATGHSQPTEVQAAVVPAALAGKDLLVSAATGSGKTLAYLLPSVQRLLANPNRADTGVLLLVVVPTRELARQVEVVCRKLCAKTPLNTLVITGGAEQKAQRAQLRKDPEILVATPGRLLEHHQKRAVDLSRVRTLVIDEADRMLDLGFRDDVLAISSLCPQNMQALLLSATLKHAGMAAIADTVLKSPGRIRIGKPRTVRDTIKHQLALADHRAHKEQLLLALLAGDATPKTLVFANKRTSVAHLAQVMRKAGLRADQLHGDLSTEDRMRVVASFREGRTRVIAASDVASRGLDIHGVELVINFDIPRSGDDYLHRSGRTGRGDSEGRAISLVDASEWNLMISIQRYLKTEFERIALPGLKARYSGPKKTKASGKAAGKQKKKKPGNTARKPERKKPQGSGSGNKADGASGKPTSDGHRPLTRRKTD